MINKAPLLLAVAGALVVVAFIVLSTSNSPSPARAGSGAVAMGPSSPSGGSGSTEEAELIGAEATPESADGMERKAASTTAPRDPGNERIKTNAHEESGHSIVGRLIGGLGAPVVEAEVTIKAVGDTADGLLQMLGGKTDKEAVTGVDGVFSVPFPARWEEISVEVKARGYHEFLETFDLLDLDTDQNLGLIELAPAVILAGRVVDYDGDPVEGAGVFRTDPGEDWTWGAIGRRFGGDEVVETGADGAFELSHEKPGEYVLVVTHDDYPVGTFPGEITHAGMMELGLVLPLKPAAVIAGEIVGYPFGRQHVRVAAVVIEPTGSGSMEGIGSSMARQFGVSPDGLDATVEKTGHFRIEGAEAGAQYMVQATSRNGFFGIEVCTDEQAVRAGDTQVKLTWDAGASVTFRVEDEHTSGAVKDVTVRYMLRSKEQRGWGSGAVKKRSYADGQVTIGELRPTADSQGLAFLVSAPGYQDLRQEGVVVQEDAQVDLGVIKLRPAGEVRILVADPEGEPIKRARVKLTPEDPSGEAEEEDNWWEEMFDLKPEAPNGTTDSEGLCVLPATTTNTATLQVSHMRYANYRREGVAMPAQGAREERVNLTEGAVILAFVVDANGNPVSGSPLRHEYPENSGQRGSSHETGRKGSVKLKNQIPGEHRFRTVEDNLVAAGEEDEDDRWQTVVAIDGRTSELVLEVPARASLHGRITANGEPLDDASVSLLRENPGENEDLILQFQVDMATYSPQGFDSTDRTDGKGNYKIDEVATGSYRISVTHKDRALPYTLPIEVNQGDNRINVELPMTAIEGRVTDGEGNPVKGSRVRAIPAAALGEQQAGLEALSEIFGRNRRRGSVRTDENGTYRLLGVPADRSIVVEAGADDDLVPARSEPITLSHGEVRRRIDLELTMGGVVQVKVQGDSSAFTFLSANYEGEGEPKPGVKMARVRRDGDAVFNGLKPGPWRVKFAEDEGGGGEGVVVEVFAGEVTTVEL